MAAKWSNLLEDNNASPKFGVQTLWSEVRGSIPLDDKPPRRLCIIGRHTKKSPVGGFLHLRDPSNGSKVV